MDERDGKEARPTKRQRLENGNDLSGGAKVDLQNQPLPNEQLQKEIQCGIRNYMRPQVPRFHGTLKTRYG